MFFVDCTVVSFDIVEEISGVELETFLCRFDRNCSTGFFIDKSTRRKETEKKKSSSDLLAERTFAFAIDDEHHIVTIEGIIHTFTNASCGSEIEGSVVDRGNFS